MEIRSITYFTDITYPLDEGPIAGAGRFLSRARAAFEAAGFRVQTVRLATQPFPAILADEGAAFRVILAGGNVRQKAAEFEAAREWLGERVIHYGWADTATYARLLWQADVVVSTALHEFFGIAVVEATYCGCFPVLPRRLAYPEVLPASHHNACLYDDFEGLLGRLRWALTDPDEARQAARGLREAVARYDWASMAPRYDAALLQVVQEQRRPA